MTIKSSEISGATLRLENLTKEFGAVTAVDHIDFAAASGEFVTLLGPSGSGKTTTLLMIAGFEAPSAGEIYIDGNPISHRPAYKRNIGLVFQHYALFPHMTVFKNIAFPLEERRLDKELIKKKVNQALEVVRLSGLGDRYPKQLSGGQQQRVALARSIVFNPHLLLMDEPLGALDKKLREELQLEIKHIQEELGITVIYVTHDQEEALTMSDRIAVMNEGRIEQVGTSTDLYERPANLFVADFIGEANFFHGEIIETEDAICGIKTDHGLILKGPRPKGLPHGSRLTFAVRPERPEFVETEVDYKNILKGIVEELIYVGDTTKYKIGFEGGDQFVIKQSSRTGGPKYGRGDNITVGWNVEDTISLVGEESPKEEDTASNA